MIINKNDVDLFYYIIDGWCIVEALSLDTIVNLEVPYDHQSSDIEYKDILEALIALSCKQKVLYTNIFSCDSIR